MACQNGQIDIMKELLMDNRVDPHIPDGRGFTPFLIACALGRTDVVKSLLDNVDININYQIPGIGNNEDGETALHLPLRVVIKKLLIYYYHWITLM